MKRQLNPDDVRWAQRRGSVATVQLSTSYSRYVHGEVVIETLYRLRGGGEDLDPPSRIFMGSDRRAVVTQLWDKLFDAVLVARGYSAAIVTIDFQRDAFEVWAQDFLITVIIAGYELGVPVTGLFLAKRRIKRKT